MAAISVGPTNYKVKLVQLGDASDIQVALNNIVYGTDTTPSGAGSISADSLYGTLAPKTSPAFVTSITSADTTFSAFPSTTTLGIGYTGSLANTTNICTGNTGLGIAKTINIGTDGQTGSIVNVNVGKTSGTAVSTINLNGKTVLSGGSLASSTTAGGIEYDGKVFYTTPNTTNNRAVVPASYYYTWTGSNYSFNTLATNKGYPALSLVSGTTYEIEAMYMMTTNTASATTTTVFDLEGTSSYTYDYYMLDYGTSTTSMLGTPVAMNTVYQTLSGAVTIGTSNSLPRFYMIKYKAIVRCTSSGTFYPAVSGSAITSNTIYPGSYIKATPIGSSTVTTIGTWA
jgi:hypothetical protein